MGLFSSSKAKQELEATKKILKQVNPDIRDGITYFDLPLKQLPKVLLATEQIEFAVRTINELAVCTNQRFILISAENTFKADVEDVAYDKINSIRIDSGLGLDNVQISVSGRNIKIKGLDKKDSKSLHDFLRNKISQPPTAASTSNDDIIEKLERLAKLREQGVLTEEEFSTQKKRILES